MSDEARDLLVYGVAAAKAHEEEEARHYLEWVLRIDADYDQQADAWYWLSTVAPSREEKRDYLQNVLAIYPNYPEARRDLAIVDGRLDPSQMLPETRRDLDPVVPSTQAGPGEIKRFRCPKCGGMTVFQPDTAVFACQFCGFRPGQEDNQQAAGLMKQTGVPDRDWIAAIYTRKGHIWELPTARMLRCQGCGANVTFPTSGISGACPFCGSPYLVEDKAAVELIRPDGVLPFAFDQAGVIQRFFSWLRSQSFTPADLGALAALEPPRPVYLPVWVFDIGGEAHWQGVVIEEHYGKSVLVLTDGLVPVIFDDIVVPGSRSPGVSSVGELELQLRRAVPYDDRLLANWPAEIYSISLSDAAVIAHEQAFKRSQKDVGLQASSIPGVDEVKVDRIEITVNSYKHLLAAVWLCNYNYKGKRYSVVVDGNGGDVRGEAPRAGVNKLLGKIFAED